MVPVVIALAVAFIALWRADRHTKAACLYGYGKALDHVEEELRRGGELVLFDPKGGDPAEWPTALRVRDFPEAAP